jgi:dihydroxycyclohexadiene carboxylate dehydrogenase
MSDRQLDLLDPRAAGARRFSDLVAIVTGAAQGIGRAAARRLAQEGASVVIADRADEPARAAAAEIASGGVTVKAIVVDLGSFQEAARLMQEVQDAFGRIDVLVNNVGGTIWTRPLWKYEEQQIREEVDRSFWPTLWCCRAALPYMIEQHSGAIVNIGSLAPRGLYRVPYAASKGGVVALTTSLALEVAAHGIRVNCVAPGVTTISDRVTPRNPSPALLTAEEQEWQDKLNESLRQETPMGRQGTPEEQAAAIAFLASADASFITGQVLCVAGGATLL